MRQLPNNRDPRLKVLIPKTLKVQLTYFAKLSKHSLQIEVIRRLAATFQYEASFNKIEQRLKLKLNSKN